MDYKRTADSLVRRHKTRNPFQIARECGYIVIRCPLIDIRGFYQHIQRRYIVYVDSELSEWDARFVCAHEIGHILMHRGENRIFADTHTYFQSSRQETEANLFALSVIYDDEDLRFFLEHPIQLAADFMGVSVDLAASRLQCLSPGKVLP